MDSIKVEFFHDVICSFCFPMSDRMRQLQKEMPEVEIIHRSFALVKQPTDFIAMFGSREKAKGEILLHWEQANQNDDRHRFNIDGMKQTDFLFPTSMNALAAAKAAYFIGGDALYWDLFDALQKSLFMANKNIEAIEVIEEAVQSVAIDLVAWRHQFAKKETMTAVLKDIELAKAYGIQSVPALIVEKTHIISGAQPLEKIKSVLNEIKLQKSLTTVAEGGACHFTNGTFDCY